MLLQNPAHDFPLYPDPAAMNDADLAKPALDGLVEVFLDDDMDLFRLESVEVNGVLDRDVVHRESI